MAAIRRRVVVAGSIGTAIEWYDFFLYGLVAPLIFDRLFFPALDPTVGTIAVFTTFAVGFVARPVGGLVFGHFGDRLGRKSVLLVTLLLMGLSTMLIGLLPTYTSIGIAAAIGLATLRFIQGFALGGEAVAAGLMTVESAPDTKRGLFAAFIQAAGPTGVVCASLSALLISRMPEADLLLWGWRIPFIISGVLVAIGLYIRLKVEESPAFEATAHKAPPARLPALDALRSYPKPITVVFFASMAETAFFYLTAIFSLSYVTRTLDLPKEVITQAVLIANVLALITVPLFGALSDRIGRKRLFMAAVFIGAVYIFFFYGLLETRNPLLIMLAITLAAGIIHPLMFGPEGSFFPELFPTRIRFSGVSIGKQFGTVLGGGIAPLIAASLFAWDGTTRPITLYFLVIAVAALIALVFSKETKDVNIAQ
jgi:metabolite-proton symporter